MKNGTIIEIYNHTNLSDGTIFYYLHILFPSKNNIGNFTIEDEENSEYKDYEIVYTEDNGKRIYQIVEECRDDECEVKK